MPATARRLDDRVLAAALLGLAVALLVLEEVAHLPGEVRVARWARSHHLPDVLRDACAFLGAIGLPIVALATMLVLARVAHRRLGPPAGLFLLASMGGPLLGSIAKAVIGQTDTWHDIAPWAGANYPSGHVVYAASCLGAAAVLMWRHDREVAIVLWVLVALMGPSRVLIGAHLISDVLAGYAVGFAWLLALRTRFPPPVGTRQAREVSGASGSGGETGAYPYP